MVEILEVIVIFMGANAPVAIGQIVEIYKQKQKQKRYYYDNN